MKYLKLLLLFLVFSCADKTLDIETQFAELFDKQFTENEPGGSILVKKGSEIIFLKNYGVADINTKEKITENTLFNTGSISKTFVANGILILEEENKLAIEDPILKYFKDFTNTKIAKKVTVKHLLAHNSGLPDARKVSENFEFYLTAEDKENFEPLKHVSSLKFEPGEKFEYSNPAYNGLALIIEKASNQKWQRFIEKRIFEPSGMKHSKITDGDYPSLGVSHAYQKENGVYKEYDYGEYSTFTAAGNGGVWSSVLDLAKYEEAIQNHVFLGEKAIEKSRTIYHPENWKDTSIPKIGCGWFIVEKNDKQNKLEVKIVSHTGSQGGFRSFYISIPEKNIVYIALFNRPVKNMGEMRTKGLALLKKYNWLD